MRHGEQDAHDARARARSTYSPGWHPLLTAVEIEPGLWEMRTQYGRTYAVIRLIEIGGERGYRAVTWAERSEDRRLLGYRTTLRGSAWLAHQYFLRSQTPLSTHGPPNGARG